MSSSKSTGGGVSNFWDTLALTFILETGRSSLASGKAAKTCCPRFLFYYRVKKSTSLTVEAQKALHMPRYHFHLPAESPRWQSYLHLLSSF